MRRRKPILGVDLGGVVIDKHAIDPITRKRYQRNHPGIPEVAYAFAVLEFIVGLRVPVFIVSSGFPEVVIFRCVWLQEHDFDTRTGIPTRRKKKSDPPSRLKFCDQRKNKLWYCRELGITHFVDDRLDVLLSLSEADVPYRYLLRVHDDDATFEKLLAELPPGIKAFRSWIELVPVLRDDIESARDRFADEAAEAD